MGSGGKTFIMIQYQLPGPPHHKNFRNNCGLQVAGSSPKRGPTMENQHHSADQEGTAVISLLEGPGKQRPSQGATGIPLQTFH